MTVSDSRAVPRPASSASGSSERALVLVGFGLPGSEAAGGLPPLPAVAQRLASLLAVPMHRLSPLQEANAALTALQEFLNAEAAANAFHQAGGPGGVVALDMDPGLTLPAGGSWAEALGAWRQPCGLVISADQLGCGWPAAGTALLQRWGVPLLGLVQWGGVWDGAARRGDGVPWLGIAAGADRRDEDEAALAAVLALRWQQLDLG